jgi:hypothetical protein
MANIESLRHIPHSRAPLSTWLGFVLLFILFGVIVLAIIGPMPRGSDFEETRAKKRVENLKALREEAGKALTTYSWVDKSKGVARIPITRAMELTVADLAKQKPAPAGPIATPASAPAAAGKPEAHATAAAPASHAPSSQAPAGSPHPVGASPAASPSSLAPVPTSPSPTKSP